jgi:hypothetical protein
MWGSGKTLAFSSTSKKEIVALLTHKVYHRVAKVQIFIIDCKSKKTSFKPWTSTIRYSKY